MKKLIKKVLNNEIFRIIFTMLLILFVLDMIFLKKILLLTILILLLLITLMIFYKLYFKVSFININKIKEYLLYLKYKKISGECIYSQNIKINTFDGSGCLTHPSVLYFENGFNGYKFWMVHTPYNNCDISLENPCIVVSNDGINFEELKEINNPLLPILKEKNPKKYYNDPNLVYTDCLELWYRYTIEHEAGKIENYVYRMTSKDGIKWSSPKLILKDELGDKLYMSLSVLYEKDIYKLYFVNNNLLLREIESTDLKKWTKEKDINIISESIWHGEIKLDNDGLYKLLFIDKNYNLCICESIDGINFSNLKKINLYCKCKDYFYFKSLVYKSSIVFVDDDIYLYTPFRYDKVKLFAINDVISHTWHLSVTKLRKENLEEICTLLDEEEL